MTLTCETCGNTESAPFAPGDSCPLCRGDLLNAKDYPAHMPWQLHYCDPYTGEDRCSQSGGEAEMAAAMERADRRGEDVWLIDPDGKKHLPHSR